MKVKFATLLLPYLVFTSPLHPEIDSGIGSRLGGGMLHGQLYAIYVYAEVNMGGAPSGQANSCVPGANVNACSPFRKTPNGLCRSPQNGFMGTTVTGESSLRGPFKSLTTIFSDTYYSGIWL